MEQNSNQSIAMKQTLKGSLQASSSPYHPTRASISADSGPCVPCKVATASKEIISASPSSIVNEANLQQHSSQRTVLKYIHAKIGTTSSCPANAKEVHINANVQTGCHRQQRLHLAMSTTPFRYSMSERTCVIFNSSLMKGNFCKCTRQTTEHP